VGDQTREIFETGRRNVDTDLQERLMTVLAFAVAIERIPTHLLGPSLEGVASYRGCLANSETKGIRILHG